MMSVCTVVAKRMEGFAVVGFKRSRVRDRM